MVIKSIILAFLLISKVSLAQCVCSKNFDSSIFNTKGAYDSKDTICFSATFISVGKISQDDAIAKLQKAGLIDRRQYKSAISFVLSNSTTRMYLPYKGIDTALDRTLWLNQNLNKKICITGVVYERLKLVNGTPFFLINKISFLN